MSDVPRFSEALEGYLDLADQLVKNWTPFVTGVSAKVDAGTYDSKAAADDFSTAAKLVADSVVAMGSEAVDALAILTSDFSTEEKVSGYSTDPAKAGSTRTLALKDDLKSVTGQVLPKARVTPVPQTLPPSVTQFTLDVNGNGIKARTYDGHVVATDAAGGVQEVFVSVTIG